MFYPSLEVESILQESFEGELESIIEGRYYPMKNIHLTTLFYLVIHLFLLPLLADLESYNRDPVVSPVRESPTGRVQRDNRL